MPVFPLVGSRMVIPGKRRPSRSPASIIERPIRSFTEPPGLNDSIFTRTVAGIPALSRGILTNGVLPNVSAKLS
jgi:hypothetical protein